MESKHKLIGLIAIWLCSAISSIASPENIEVTSGAAVIATLVLFMYSDNEF